MNNQNSKTLEQVLWNCADILRGKMDANEYKDYVLGLLFYKYLSDKLLNETNHLLELKETTSLEAAQKQYKAYFSDEDFLAELKQTIGFVLSPELTFQNLIDEIKMNTFQTGSLKKAFQEIEEFGKTFEGIFDDINLDSRKLGENENEINKVISQIMLELNNVNLLDYSTDALGDAYEYMLSQFASESGKKAGEFYTPKAVANLLAKIVMLGQENTKNLTVYDPTCGSGSLLLDISKYSSEKQLINYWGQEKNGTTLSLAKMNMFIHGVEIDHQHLRRGDTLSADWPVEEITDFNCVVMNPPYSAKWSADSAFLNSPRFSNYGVLAPKTKADYAFLLHGFYHLKQTGTMGIVLPHGVLFRGSSEGKIRKKLVDDGSIYAIIGLPSNLFYSTSIPTIIMILKKKRDDQSRDILFIDASKDFEKNKNQNVLTEQNIEDIISMYKDRKDVDKKCHLAKYEEIVNNDYNLNIPRYVDTFEKEEDINISDLINDLDDINKELSKTNQEILSSVKELTSKDDSLKEDIEKLIKFFSEEK